MANQGSDFGGSQVMAPAADGAASRAMVTAPPVGPGLGAPAFAPRGPEILVGSFNQTWLVNCLRRRWLLASLMGLLIGGSVGGLLMWLFPESSRITSFLEVKSDDASSPFEDRNRPINQAAIQREAAMHPALMKSPLVLEAAVITRDDIHNLDAVQYHAGEEVLWLMNDLKVNFATDSPILQVEYEGQEPAEDMVKVVNAVVQSYKDNVLLQARTTQTTTQDDLKAVLVSVQGDLKKKLDAMKLKNSVSDYQHFHDVEYPKLKTDIAMYQTQLIMADKEMADIEVLKEVSIQQAQSPSALDAAVQAEMDKDPTINNYKQTLFELSSQVQQLQASSKNGGSAQLRRLQSAYAQTEEAMKQYRAKAEKDARDRLAKIPNEALRAAIVEYKVRLKYITDKKAEFETKLKEAEARIAEMSVGDPEVEMLEQDIESQQALALSLDTKVREWDALNDAKRQRPGKDSDYDKVRVIQPAVPTEKINVYERWAIAGIGGLAAMALTCYGVALMEFRHRRLNGPNDMDEGLGVRVLGVLPPTSLKTLAGSSLVASQVAEAIDNVRATIMHDSTSRPRQVVMVSSPGTMEGCTTVAASLALSLARAGHRTLLIDGDLRAPALHKLFGMPLEDGLSEVLRAEIDLADAVHPTTSEGLHLLTAGVCDMDAIHALATDQPQAIFDKLRDQFDFIVIDAPPVLGISDSLSLGQYIDGAVLTVLRDHSEIRRIHQAIETLRAMGVRVIGTVVNGVPVRADRRVLRLHQASAQRTPRLPAKAPEA